MTAALNAWSDESGAVCYVERETDTVVARRVEGHVASYLRSADVDRELLRALRASRFIAGISQEGDWLRIAWRSRKGRDAACGKDGWFASQNIATYEGDLPPVRRWLVDAEVEIQRPRLVYLDIETCARVPFSRKEEMRILCWTLTAAEDGRVCSGMLDEDTDKDERRLLNDLWTALDQFDQVAAWNGDRFDFPVIFERSRRRGCRVDARRWLWLDHLELYRRMNTMAETGDEKQSYALQAVAMAVLGEGKLPGFDAKTIFPAWAAGGEERARLLAYNVRDVELMLRIEEKTGFIELLYTLCSATGAFPDSHGIRPMPQVETFVMRLARARGIHFPTKFRRNEDEEHQGAFRGAFVMEPQVKGIVTERCHVADFSAMYPSIIQSWNMSPETLVERPPIPTNPVYLRHLPPPKAPERPANVAVAPGTGEWFSQSVRGLLAEVLDIALALRKKWNDLKATLPPGTPEWIEADRRSTAYKVFANSVFGVIGAELSRIHVREVAESITRTGAWLIQKVIDAARERGIRVIYGDTDSMFALGCTDAEFRVFVEWCNTDLFPRLVRECGCADNRIKLAYEKAFDRVVFVSAKRYAARWAHYKGTLPDERTRPEVKGLEYKRGDSCRLARQMQAEIIDLLMGGGVLGPRRPDCCDDVVEFEAAVARWKERVLVAPLEVEDVLLSKRLTRALKEYAVRKKKDGTDGAAPPHVRVAKILQERGADVGEGTRIAYFVTDGATKPALIAPAEDWVGECDRFAVWEDQVWSPAERVLAAAFPAVGWGQHARVRPAQRLVRVARGSSGRTATVSTGGEGGSPERFPPPSGGQLGLFGLDPPVRPRKPHLGAGDT